MLHSGLVFRTENALFMVARLNGKCRLQGCFFEPKIPPLRLRFWTENAAFRVGFSNRKCPLYGCSFEWKMPPPGLLFWTENDTSRVALLNRKFRLWSCFCELKIPPLWLLFWTENAALRASAAWGISPPPHPPHYATVWRHLVSDRIHISAQSRPFIRLFDIFGHTRAWSSGRCRRPTSWHATDATRYTLQTLDARFRMSHSKCSRPFFKMSDLKTCFFFFRGTKSSSVISISRSSVISISRSSVISISRSSVISISRSSVISISKSFVISISFF